MIQTQTTLFGGMCVLLVLVSACATVNPRPDYDRAAQLITQATGQNPVYRPEGEPVVKNAVAALLADGITAQEAVQLCLLLCRILTPNAGNQRRTDQTSTVSIRNRANRKREN